VHARRAAQAEDANAQAYPTLFAFHGSSVKNWSSILRQGLHFRETINGRAYGNGVRLPLPLLPRLAEPTESGC